MDKVGADFLNASRRGGAKIITCDPENLNPVCFRVKKEPPGDFSANFENEFLIVFYNEKSVVEIRAQIRATPKAECNTKSSYQALGPGPRARALGLGFWAPGPGPEPGARGPGPRAGAWGLRPEAEARGPGPGPGPGPGRHGPRAVRPGP